MFPVLVFSSCFSEQEEAQRRDDEAALRQQVDLLMRAARIPSREKLAIVLDMSPGQLQRQLQLQGHFSFTRVVSVLGRDPKFWPRYAWELACEFGLPGEARRGVMFMLGLMGRRRKQKMATIEPSRKWSA